MRRLVLILFANILTLIAAKAAEVSFTASAPSVVVVGSEFLLTYTLTAEGENFRAPVIQGFEIKAGPSTSRQFSTQIINGSVSQETVNKFTYVLQPVKEGTFQIGAATVDVKGRKFSSNVLNIKVLKGDDAKAQQQVNDEARQSYGFGDKDLFVRAIVSKKTPFVNEGVLITYKLYTRVSLVGLSDVSFPELNDFLAFEVDKATDLSYSMENINGLNYRTAILKQTFAFPQKNGVLTIPQAKIECVVRVQNRRNSMDIFDDFFGTTTDVKKTVYTEKQTVNVKALPIGNQPADYSGIVGQLNIKSDISGTSVKANESITLKVTVSGSGNLKLLEAPKIAFPSDFEVYDPTINNNFKTTSEGTSGVKSFEYVIIPRHAGNYEIPETKFSYFDVSSGSYKTLAIPSYNLTISKGTGNGNNGDVLTSYVGKEDVKVLGKDIRFITNNRFKIHRAGEYFYGSGLFWLFILLPLILFGTAWVMFRRNAELNANVVLAQNRKANKMALKRLKTAEGLMKADKKEQFYEEVLRALWQYSGYKLGISPSDLNRDNIGQMLNLNQVPAETITALIELLDTCEFARYAPGAVTGGLQQTFDNAVSVIGNIEHQIVKK